ncbi:MAG: hypothetical protein DRG83_05280 [Deltaproteobacteria bacterium]|nr:MAG: hypothetical protein DRG83_05280 [Deltaproteobacteria bacterium]
MKMRIVVVINFSRSGGTLLTRILGMLPDIVIASEINPLLGATPENQAAAPALALKRQMEAWYGISLFGENFVDVVRNLADRCNDSGKQLIIRDWTHLDFRKGKHNGWRPTYRFRIIEELNNLAELVPFAFVRDAIDVYLSSGGDLKDFASDYLAYTRELVKLGAPIVKYEDLVSQPDKTVKRICDICDLRYSEDYKNFSTNRKCTGDIQLGRTSRGGRQQSICLLPRKWVSKQRRVQINACRDLVQANRLLGYPLTYSNGNTETFCQMVLRRIRNKVETLKRQIYKE